MSKIEVAISDDYSMHLEKKIHEGHPSSSAYITRSDNVTKTRTHTHTLNVFLEIYCEHALEKFYV